jgi:hypothetical protein
LVLLGGIFLLVRFDRPPALPEVMILPPTAFTMQEGRIPDRWIPAKWTWLQQKCRLVFGPPKWDVFDIQCPEITNTAAFIIDRNSLGRPDAEGGGMALWILSYWKLIRLDLHAPRSMGTALYAKDRMKATTQLGWRGDIRADFFLGRDTGTDDLSIRLATPTNSGITVRVQLHRDKALFFMDVRRPELATNRTAIEIWAREEPLVPMHPKGLKKMVSGTINSNTGPVTVTLGSDATNVTGHGAILLNATNGGGNSLTKTNSQASKLGP